MPDRRLRRRQHRRRRRPPRRWTAKTLVKPGAPLTPRGPASGLPAAPTAPWGDVLAAFAGPAGLAWSGTGMLVAGQRPASAATRDARGRGHHDRRHGARAGQADGPALSATLDTPSAVAASSNGTVYLIDPARPACCAAWAAMVAWSRWRWAAPHWSMRRRWRRPTTARPSWADAGAGRLLRVAPDGSVQVLRDDLLAPGGVALDAQGRVYVSDTGHHVIRRWTRRHLGGLRRPGRQPRLAGRPAHAVAVLRTAATGPGARRRAVGAGQRQRRDALGAGQRHRVPRVLDAGHAGRLRRPMPAACCGPAMRRPGTVVRLHFDQSAMILRTVGRRRPQRFAVPRTRKAPST